jgi:hypothetical protein
VTVIAEAVLEERLLADLRRWGVGGLTLVRAEGDPFGSRVGDVEGAFLRHRVRGGTRPRPNAC